MTNDYSEKRDVCPFCGGDSFVWGLVRNSAGHFVFVPGESFLERLKNLTAQSVKTRRCNGCNNLQFFIEE